MSDFSMVNLSLGDPKGMKKQRTVEALSWSGVIPAAQQTDVQMVKRINHALYADHASDELSPALVEKFTAMQNEFRPKLQVEGEAFKQAVEAGVVNQLLDQYLGLMVEASQERLQHLNTGTLKGREETDPAFFNELRNEAIGKIDKYSTERTSYSGDYMTREIREIALRNEALLKQDHYLRMVEIVQESALVNGDKAYTGDLARNVETVQVARGMKALLKQFDDTAVMEQYAADPQANKVRIEALADRVAHATKSLRSLREFQAETPSVDLPKAINMLAEAQLHYAIMQSRDPEQKIAVEREAREQVREAALVELSLAYHNLNEGPAKDDARTLAIKGNLVQEMKDSGFGEPLALGEAKTRSAVLARKAAEDLLQVQAVHDDAKMSATIVTLAQAACVDTQQEPLRPKPQLIGEDLLEVIRQKLDQKNIIVPKELLSFAEAELAKRQKATKKQATVAA